MPHAKTIERGLNRRQKTQLKKEPEAHAIRTRMEGGKPLSYLEGWFVIAEANRIFGTENWDRITLTTQCVWQGRLDGHPACAYTARVRLCLRAGCASTVREGSGFGLATGTNPGEAHGQALKAAETDATKRALATLGAPFGLMLYDQHGKQTAAPVSTEPTSETRERHQTLKGDPQGRDGFWMIFSENGEVRAAYRDPILGCSTLRRALEHAETPAALQRVFDANRRFIARLAYERADLRDHTDRHYSEILSAVYQKRLKQLTPPPGATGMKPETNGHSPAPGAGAGSGNKPSPHPERPSGECSLAKGDAEPHTGAGLIFGDDAPRIEE